MQLLLIDLDDTLIDTHQLKMKLISQLEEAGFSDAQEVYDQNRKNVKNWLEDFPKALASTPEQIDQINRVILDNIDSLGIIQPVIDYLNDFEGYKVLYTFGNKIIQERKIFNLNLDQLVDKVIITTDDKVSFLGEMIDNNRQVTIDNQSFSDVTFVDDKHEILEMLNNKYPWIKTINSREIIES